LPGGKMIEGELPKLALVREIFEETGILFKEEEFELLNVQNRIEDGTDNTIYAYACTKLISEMTPIETSEKHIQPVFMEASMFYTLTKYKEFYTSLFPQE
jgi:ADP-ribose pyrophosphatase YjhB (NUDIX family)